MQLLCTAVAHVGGTVALAVVAAGGRVVLQPGFDAGRVLAAIARERVTVIQLMPRLLHRLLDHPDLATTDTAPRLRATVGRPVPGVEVAVCDDEGHDLPAGAEGALRVRSAAVLPGYVGAPEESAAVLRDGWLDTGDVGRVDDAGYVTLVGRTKDVIIAEHAHVHPVAVETELLAHPDVAAAAVIALVDRDGAESAVAAVEPRPGRVPDPAALVAWVADRRGRDRGPRDVRVVDALPVLPSGKVDRAEVRRRLASSS